MRKWSGILGISRALRIEGVRRMRDCAVIAIAPVKRCTMTPYRNEGVSIHGLMMDREEVRTAERLAKNGTEMNATTLNKLNRWRV